MSDRAHVQWKVVQGVGVRELFQIGPWRLGKNNRELAVFINPNGRGRKEIARALCFSDTARARTAYLLGREARDRIASEEKLGGWAVGIAEAFVRLLDDDAPVYLHDLRTRATRVRGAEEEALSKRGEPAEAVRG